MELMCFPFYHVYMCIYIYVYAICSKNKYSNSLIRLGLDGHSFRFFQSWKGMTSLNTDMEFPFWGLWKMLVTMAIAVIWHSHDANGIARTVTPNGSKTYEFPFVAGLEHFLFFHSVGNNHPTWLIFFRGVGQPPTRFPFVAKIWSTCTWPWYKIPMGLEVCGYPPEKNMQQDMENVGENHPFADHSREESNGFP